MRNDPTRRALRLLSLLQTRKLWGGSELADRLGVTERTVRRDVDRLRGLGYPVDATPGRDGGYRLSAGTSLPPLVFDDDEAVAVAVGLRAAAGLAISGIDHAAVQALAKIEQVLPHRLQLRVTALDTSVVSLRRSHSDEGVVEPGDLTALAAACRDHERVHFNYRRPDGNDTRRWVEPHQLLSAGHRWYLVAWDLGREDWRTFRLDRLGSVESAGGRFTPRTIPEGDAASFFSASVASLVRGVEALVVVRAPYQKVAEALAWVDHAVVDDAADSCAVRLHPAELDALLMTVASLAVHASVQVVEPRALAVKVDALVGRLSGGEP